MTVPDDDQLPYVYSVDPGTPPADAMRLLGSWAATDDAQQDHRASDHHSAR